MSIEYRGFEELFSGKDITKQKWEHENLLSIIDHLPAFVSIHAKDYSVPFVNRFFHKRFGDNKDKRCYEIYLGRKEPCEKCPTSAVFDTKIPRKWRWNNSLDGHIYQIYDSPFTDAYGTPLVLKLGIDITRFKKMEEELLKAQKLESLGILAGGIAHDFNNLLTVILGSISLSKRYTDPDKIFEILTMAENASLRTMDLIQQLLTFSGGRVLDKKIASSADLIKDSARFTLSGSNVKCEFAIPDDLWPVEVDKEQMSQVIHNLVINASEAMPEGGTITIRAENITLGIDDLLPLKKGKYIKISVEDNGRGILEENLSKIFDPYLSTKEMGVQKGMGLGLAIAYSIIKNHEGLITVESEVGKGTTFYIYLPAVL